MDTIKRTPEQNRADALRELRHHLRNARRDAVGARDRAMGVVWKMDAVLGNLPIETDIMALDEAALMAAVARQLEALGAAANEGVAAAKNLDTPLGRLLGAIDEAGHMHRYLTAGNFSDED